MDTDKDKKDDIKTGKGNVLGNGSEKSNSNDRPQLNGQEVTYPDGKGGGYFP
ncbi:hypothetical protein KAJ89_01175 [Candidatus Parcubacteria bacterium]|nr:hypothetical protein [Candidatus Parcubacteria bacterium]